MRDDKPMDLDDAEEPPRRKKPLRAIPRTDWYRHPAVIVGGVCGVLILFAMIGVGAWLVLSAKKKGRNPSAF